MFLLRLTSNVCTAAGHRDLSDPDMGGPGHLYSRKKSVVLEEISVQNPA